MGCADSKHAEQPGEAPSTEKSAGGDAANGTRNEGKGGPKRGKLNLSGILPTSAGDVRTIYSFDRVLGKGNFGVVHLVHHRKTGKPFACKSISKRKLVNQDDIDDVRREVEILLHLSGHPNVVQLHGAYEDKGYVHLVMECCAGGELFDRIASKGHFSEKMAAEYMRTIVSVVHHCHTMNVIHRDLKPENFLLSSKDNTAVLKATDFGLSRFFKDGQVLDEIVGSPFYVAPEVLQRKYGKHADIWSCGVILYILLCGYPPFHGDNTNQIFKNVMTQPLDVESDPWPKISKAAKDCVRRMLTRNPRKRLTAEQLLKHPWMKENGAALDEMITPEVLTRLQKFGKMNFLKKEALKVIARSLPESELQGIKEMFASIDEDGSGQITVDELREGLRKKGAELALDAVSRILDDIDGDGNQQVDYEEFTAATIHLSKLNREELMIEAFKHFDKDDSGTITMDELQLALDDLGIKGADITGILAAADSNDDGVIDYEEFCDMMRNQEFEALIEAKNAMKSQIGSVRADADFGEVNLQDEAPFDPEFNPE